MKWPPTLVAAAGCAISGQGFAQQAFFEWDAVTALEDRADAASDADQNDFAIRHASRCDLDAAGDLASQTVHAVALAAGASYTNGVAADWRSAPEPPALVQIAWANAGGGFDAPTTLCAGDCGTRTLVFADAHEAFLGPGAGFVNTVPGEAVVPGRPFRLVATWGPSAAFLAPCDLDWSLVRGAVTIDDASTLPNGQPLVGDFPDVCDAPTDAECSPEGSTPRRPFALPTETTSIAEAYGAPFLAWLADRIGDSNGDGAPDTDPCTPGSCASEDWFRTPVPGKVLERAGDLSETAALPPLPTCADGLANGGEEGVDCGGACPACVIGKRVFVSSTTWPGTFGGGSDPLAVADGICQDLADAAGLGGTYRAWLSDATRSPNTRFTRSASPYVLVDGTVVAGNYDELVDWRQGVRVPIDRTEAGDALATGSVWTGTFATGDRGNLGTMCNHTGGTAWSVTTGGPGAVGYLHASGYDWTESGNSASCTESHRFYCFEQ